MHNFIRVRCGHVLADRKTEQVRVAAIDKEILSRLTERGIGLKFGNGDRIMDTRLNSAGTEVDRKCIAPPGAHDEQMIDLPRPVLAHRKGQRSDTLQLVEVMIGNCDAMLRPAV